MDSNKFKHIFMKLRKKYSRGRCMHIDETGNRCKNPSIDSHSIQKNGRLANIAEGSQVYRLGANLFANDFQDLVDFTIVGKSKASIFPGFCKKHDNDIFSPIENKNAILNKWSILLI